MSGHTARSQTVRASAAWLLAVGSAACAAAPAAEEDAAVGVEVTVQITQCPLIMGMSVTPAEVVVGEPVAINATMTSEVTKHRWSADGGSFDDPRRLRTTFTCDVPGWHLLRLHVADGVECQDSAFAAVRCTAD